MESTVLNKNRSNGASALIKTGLDNRTLSRTVGVSLKLLHLGNKRYHLEQVVKTFLCLCRNGNTRCVAAPFLGNKLILCKLLLNLLGVSADLIHLINSHDHRNSGSLGVVDSLNGLRHNTVVRRNYENCDIRYLSASCAHCGERLVSGGVEEGDRSAVYRHPVRADVLGNTACLACGNVCVADSVED